MILNQHIYNKVKYNRKINQEAVAIKKKLFSWNEASSNIKII